MSIQTSSVQIVLTHMISSCLMASHFVSFLDFSVPGVPLHVSHVIKDGTLNRFSVLITWTNSKPATPMDYPVTASYVNWGFSRSINDNSEIAVATVNGVS